MVTSVTPGALSPFSPIRQGNLLQSCNLLHLDSASAKHRVLPTHAEIVDSRNLRAPYDGELWFQELWLRRSADVACNIEMIVI